MKKVTVVVLISLLSFSCSTNRNISSSDESNPAVTYSNTITRNDIKEHVFTLASGEYEGRRTGELGQKKAAEYLANEYHNYKLTHNPVSGDYYQNVPLDYLSNKSSHSSENVIAYIKGSEKPDEVIVVSSHYDHEGIKNNEIYYGADDNASGTAAVLEIAQAFSLAKTEGYRPKRSILFINFTAEEKGLLGSKYYIKNPVFPLKNTVANLNIDMIGRIGSQRENNLDYIYVIGSDRLSSELHEINENANKDYVGIELDYTYNSKTDRNRFYYRSDHYNFAKNKIPVIFYFNGTHKDYHKPTDTPDKINLDLLTKRTQLIFHTTWELANREKRILIDSDKN